VLRHIGSPGCAIEDRRDESAPAGSLCAHSGRIARTNYLVFNLADRSRFYSPGLTFSLRTNVDLTVGTQFFRGNAGTEYARFPNLYYAQLQWFF
jgi:hypothetical protein